MPYSATKPHIVTGRWLLRLQPWPQPVNRERVLMHWHAINGVIIIRDREGLIFGLKPTPLQSAWTDVIDPKLPFMAADCKVAERSCLRPMRCVVHREKVVVPDDRQLPIRLTVVVRQLTVAYHRAYNPGISGISVY